MSDEYEPPLITNRYSREAVRLINMIYKNLSITAYIIIALVTFSILDVLGILYLLGITSEYTHDVIITLILLIVLALFSILFLHIMRIKRVLRLWHDRFEESSLETSIDLLVSDKRKEEVIYALAESIEEINPYLEEYIKRKDIDRFIDVRVDDLKFDILIDEDTADGTLRHILKDYGSIIVKIADKADQSMIDKFYKDLLAYNRIKGRRVGLAIVIADEVKPIKIKHKGIDRVLFINKDTTQPPLDP